MKKSKKPTNRKKEIDEKKHKRWVLTITIVTFFSTIFVTYISDVLLDHSPLLISFLILIFIIVFGVLSDIVGVAITAVDPKPFNSMASQKVFGAKTAVKLIKKAPQFSNICNDVVGDICGIVSGATGVAITGQFLLYFPFINSIILSLILSGLIAAFTVGGKAVGKDYALKNSVSIIKFVSIIIASFKRIWKIKE